MSKRKFSNSNTNIGKCARQKIIYKCNFNKCDFECFKSYSLVKHKRTHTGDKPYLCDFSGCDYKCADASNLIRHKRTHTGVKPYKCDYDGCDYKSSDSGSLTKHKRTHTGEKPFTCDFDGCDFQCARKNHLQIHKNIHIGNKPYVCDYDGCDYKSAQSNHLAEHKRTHTGDRPYVCDFNGCDYKSVLSSDLSRHKRTHTGDKPYVCDFNYCDYKCARNDALVRHKKAMHSEKGQRRHKKEEEKIEKFLKKNDIHYDREVVIDFKCALGGDRGQTYSKIDFIVELNEVTFLIEVDEREHSDDGYQLKCETRRMADTYTSLMISTQNIKNVVWIRYNPHTFSVDEVKQKVKPKTRQENLLKIIQTYKPTLPMEVLYLYYTSQWSQNNNIQIPIIFNDTNFPETLKFMCKIY
jgi:hypothetical protein